MIAAPAFGWSVHSPLFYKARAKSPLWPRIPFVFQKGFRMSAVLAAPLTTAGAYSAFRRDRLLGLDALSRVDYPAWQSKALVRVSLSLAPDFHLLTCRFC